MKQPKKTDRSNSTAKRKTRAELNLEGRERKRQNNRKGLRSGNRANPGSQSTTSKRDSMNADPRKGSKIPVPLIAEGPVVARPVVLSQEQVCAKLSPAQELEALENNPRLDQLLDRLEVGESLSPEDQIWLDTTLDRIEALMVVLGIDLNQQDDEQDEQADEDMYRLLKGQ